MLMSMQDYVCKGRRIDRFFFFFFFDFLPQTVIVMQFRNRYCCNTLQVNNKRDVVNDVERGPIEANVATYLVGIILAAPSIAPGHSDGVVLLDVSRPRCQTSR